MDRPPPPPSPVPPRREEVAQPKEVAEKIVLAGTPPAPPPEPRADRFQLRGWLRSITSVQTGERGFQPQAPIPGVLPYDRLVNREQIYLDLRYARGKRFEVAASGLLALNVFEAETASAGVRFNGFNGADTRFTFEPELREAYVGVFAGPLDLRIGQQRLAWGKGDFFTPNDVINPRDLRDPLLNETELLTLPVPLVRADLDLGAARLQGVFAPFLVPDRIALFNDNWAMIQPDAPAAYRQALFWASRSQDPRIRLAASGLGALIGKRDAQFSDASAGARLSWSAGGVDVAHYYHYGFSTRPRVDLPPELVEALRTTDLVRTTQEAFDRTFGPLAELPAQITYPRRHHVGLGVGTTAGPFALRFDAGYDSATVFYDRNLASVVRDVVQAVAAAEYQTGDEGKTVLIEARYARVLGSKPSQQLLFFDLDSVAVAALARWTFWSWLELELRGVLGTKPLSYLAHPQVAFRRGGWSFRLGGLILGGDPLSFGEYFRRNAAVYLGVKHSF